LFLEKVIGEAKIKQVIGQITEEIKRLAPAINGEMSRRQLQKNLALKSRANFEERYLKPALDAGLIEPTIPLKPKSRLQRYRLTEKGEEMKSE
jgi:ATP-dependent DNA helicase RecG